MYLPDFSAMGRNLLTTAEDSGFAFWISGQGIGWVEGNHIGIMGAGGEIPLIYDCAKGDFQTDLGAVDETLRRRFLERATAFYQFSADLPADDNIFPRDR